MKNLGMITLGIVSLMFINKQAKAQLSGMQTAYYLNQYQVNPAMAGIDTGLNVNLAYQAQWTSVPGGPKLQSLTADYSSGNNVGIGLNIASNDAGLINRTRMMGTFAYHLPLNDNGDKLHFGLSAGINDTYIDYTKVQGDQGDASVQAFNQRSIYVDGDLGVAYTSNKLNLQAALPNLKSVFFNSDGQSLEVDRATFYTAASYKIHLEDGTTNITFEPKVAFRGVKGFDNIIDAGMNMTMNEYKINVSGMYHSNKAATLSLGTNGDVFGLLFSYTYNTGPLAVYANNTFEFGLRVRVFNNR